MQPHMRMNLSILNEPEAIRKTGKTGIQGRNNRKVSDFRREQPKNI